MLVLGLHGKIGAGKDTVADFLVARYGFVKFAFSDALYREVQEAFGLEDQSLLRDRATKEEPLARLALRHCSDEEFIKVAIAELDKQTAPKHLLYPAGVELSPRQVLRWWGTEYRRGQDERYWIKRAHEFILTAQATQYPEHAPQHFVEVGTRFPDEQAFIHRQNGNVWHIIRPDNPFAVEGVHVSDQKLAVLEGERVLVNGDTIERLHYGVNLLMATTAQTVKVLPMLTITEDELTP